MKPTQEQAEDAVLLLKKATKSTVAIEDAYNLLWDYIFHVGLQERELQRKVQFWLYNIIGLAVIEMIAIIYLNLLL